MPARTPRTAAVLEEVAQPVNIVANGRNRRHLLHQQAAVKLEQEVFSDRVSPPPPPASKRPRKSSEKAAAAMTRQIAASDAADDADVVEEKHTEDVKPKRRRKSAKAVASEAAGDASVAQEDEDFKPEKPKAKRTKKAKEPKVYVIPDITRHRDFRLEGPPEKRAERSQGFRGRLGYACLNTVLRNQDPPVFCSRNIRIKTIDEKGLAFVKDLALQNVRDIIPLLEWNAANNIHMMRLSSEIFPFASHEVYGYDIDFAAEELAKAGEAAKRLGQRLTMHPGQFCQLGTPKQSVLEASLRELDVHAKVLDLMGVGPEGVMILHGGGTFGDREATLERIRDTINNRLSASVRRRLVLENDELGYSAEELLPICESVDPPVPLVFDFHHDMLRPSSLSPAQIVERAQAIFQRRGVPPKYHLSEPRPGASSLRERRAHSDRCLELPPDLPADADLMLECKDKEQGVLEMYRIYKLFDVRHDVLRPPADDMSMATSGRRSKLDGSGGATKSRRGNGQKSSASPASDDDDDDDEDGKLTKKGTPKKERVTEASLVERAIAKAKAVAAKRGIPYTGPRSREEIDADRALLMSSEMVKRDMEKHAEWVRNELRNGRERRPFPGSVDAEQEQRDPESQFQPEPEAY